MIAWSFLLDRQVDRESALIIDRLAASEKGAGCASGNSLVAGTLQLLRHRPAAVAKNAQLAWRIEKHDDAHATIGYLGSVDGSHRSLW